MQQQHATKTTSDQIRTSTGAIEVPNAAIIATCVRAHHTFSCPYASCIDCCIGHSNSARAGPDLIVGGCNSMLLLDPALICTDAGSDLLHIALVVIPSITWLKYSVCTSGSQHLLQLALVVFFLPSTGANTPLAHMVVITHFKLCLWCFCFQPLAQILHLHLCKWRYGGGGGKWWYNQNIRDREHRLVTSKAQTGTMEADLATSWHATNQHRYSVCTCVVLLQLALCGVGGTLLVLTKYNLPWCCFCTSNQCRYSICTYAIYI